MVLYSTSNMGISGSMILEGGGGCKLNIHDRHGQFYGCDYVETDVAKRFFASAMILLSDLALGTCVK